MSEKKAPKFASVQVANARTLAVRYHWIVQPLLAFLVTRLIVAGAGYAGHIMLPTDPGHWNPAPEHTFLGLWARWDSQWYNWIIREGYWLNPQERSNVAFFPLYPLLVKTLSPLFGNHIILTGIVVGNVAFLGALIFLYALTELEFKDRATARRAVYYLAIFPTSFFFSAMYTESLFLLFSIAAIYFARLDLDGRRLWTWAALMGILASAVRVIGVLTWGLVMWEWLRVHGWTLATLHRPLAWRNLWAGLRRDWVQVLVIALIPLGLISYMAFLQLNFRDPLAFVTVQSAWGRQNIGPLAVALEDARYLLEQGFNRGNLSRMLNLSTLLAVSLTSIAVWKRLGAGYGIYTLLLILIPTSSASQSAIRYVLACFPVFMILGKWGQNTFFDRLVTIGFATLLGVLTAVFVNWFFVA